MMKTVKVYKSFTHSLTYSLTEAQSKAGDSQAPKFMPPWCHPLGRTHVEEAGAIEKSKLRLLLPCPDVSSRQCLSRVQFLPTAKV
jgi:hypothetical protein